MPWDGSGNYTRTNGTHTGANVWANARDDGNAAITATEADTHDQDIATAINNCLTKDGQNTATANLPMGGYRHTGVGNSSARTHYAATGQVQDGAFMWGGTATGSLGAFAISVSPSPGAYAAGQRFVFVANHTFTGTPSLNVNGIGAVAIRPRDGSGGFPILNGQLIVVYYDGTQFRVEDPQRLDAAGSPVFAGLNLSGLTASRVVITDGSKNLASQTQQQIVDEVPLGAWSVSVAVSPGAFSGLTVHEAHFARMGPYIPFQLRAILTVSGSPTAISFNAPWAGVAHNSNCDFPCNITEDLLGTPTPINGGRWRYDGTNLVIFKPLNAAFPNGQHAIAISGFYRRV